MTEGTGKTENRLTILEEKLEYQDYTLEKLNDVIITQQKQLDRLETDLVNLHQKIEAERDGVKAKQQGAAQSGYD
ncbi:MAG: SlyX family protein [Desulfocapsaceae bacterium]|nr:SlyX family protein [Desulfocapsaceae bacterium]